MNSLMIDEAMAAPDRVRTALLGSRKSMRAAVEALKRFQPQFAVTIARGSSDHAAAFLAYALSSRLGLLCGSLPPSLVTVHSSPLNFRHCLALAISQSGASPDLREALRRARAGGALALAFVNQEGSELERVADHTVLLGAGEEKAIAATKSFIVSLLCGLLTFAEWDKRIGMFEDFEALPECLDRAVHMPFGSVWGQLETADNLIVLSRGLGFPIAQEVALKFNEVCRLHAMAFSSAEFWHGPMALIRQGDPVLLIGIRGPELAGLVESVQHLRELGASVIFMAPERTPGATVTYPVSSSLLFDPVMAIQALYPVIAKISELRGLDPDRPLHIKKVTRTF